MGYFGCRATNQATKRAARHARIGFLQQREYARSRSSEAEGLLWRSGALSAVLPRSGCSVKHPSASAPEARCPHPALIKSYMCRKKTAPWTVSHLAIATMIPSWLPFAIRPSAIAASFWRTLRLKQHATYGVPALPALRQHIAQRLLQRGEAEDEAGIKQLARQHALPVQQQRRHFAEQ